MLNHASLGRTSLGGIPTSTMMNVSCFQGFDAIFQMKEKRFFLMVEAEWYKNEIESKKLYKRLRLGDFLAAYCESENFPKRYFHHQSCVMSFKLRSSAFIGRIMLGGTELGSSYECHFNTLLNKQEHRNLG